MLRWCPKIVAVRIALVWLALSMVVGASEAANPAAVVPDNPMCPVMLGSAVDPEFWLDYNGKRIWFCCDNCRARFIANPDFFMPNVEDEAYQTAGTTGSGEPAGFVGSLIGLAGRWHPVAVHFPIALALAALLAEIMTIMTGARTFLPVSRFLLWTAVAGALLAAPFGWAAAHGAGYSEVVQQTVFRHRWLGTGGGAILLIALLAREVAEKPKDRKFAWGLYRLSLFVGAVAIALAGYFGGVLVYGPDHFRF